MVAAIPGRMIPIRANAPDVHLRPATWPLRSLWAVCKPMGAPPNASLAADQSCLRRTQAQNREAAIALAWTAEGSEMPPASFG